MKNKMSLLLPQAQFEKMEHVCHTCHDLHHLDRELELAKLLLGNDELTQHNYRRELIEEFKKDVFLYSSYVFYSDLISALYLGSKDYMTWWFSAQAELGERHGRYTCYALIIMCLDKIHGCNEPCIVRETENGFILEFMTVEVEVINEQRLKVNS